MEIQKCKYHPNKEPIRKCSICGAPLCENCVQLDGSKIVCKQCLNSSVDKNDNIDYSTIELDINDYVIDMSDVEDIDINIDDILKEVEEATRDAKEQSKQAKMQTREIQRQTKEQTKEIKRQSKEQTKEIKRQTKETVKRQVNQSVNESMKKYNVADENLGYNKYYNQSQGRGNNMKKNYSDTLAILLSFIPGASQMYLGLINRGLLICFLFCASFFLLHIPLVYIPIWITSIFDARKIRKQMDQGENVKDDTSDIVKIISNPYVVLIVAVMLVLKIVGAVISILSGTSASWAVESVVVLCVIFFISEYRKKKRGK